LPKNTHRPQRQQQQQQHACMTPVSLSLASEEVHFAPFSWMNRITALCCTLRCRSSSSSSRSSSEHPVQSTHNTDRRYQAACMLPQHESSCYENSTASHVQPTGALRSKESMLRIGCFGCHQMAPAMCQQAISGEPAQDGCCCCCSESDAAIAADIHGTLGVAKAVMGCSCDIPYSKAHTTLFTYSARMFTLF
jgi:hypothetical protein